MLRGGNLRGPICLVLLALFLVFAGAAAAGEVFLKSGDRLRGTIEGIDPKEVTLQTTYAGRIRIRRQEVAAIQADLPLRVTFPSGTRLVGTIAPRYGDTLQLVTPDFRRAWEFRFADIQTATRQTATRTGPPKAAVSPTVSEGGKLELQGRLNLGFDADRGNTDKDNYHVDGEVNARMKRHRAKLAFEYNREKTDGRETDDNTIVSAKYDYFLTKRWFAFLNASFERDKFEDLNRRTVTGWGAGYQFFDTEERDLSAEFGFSYVTEGFSTQKDKDYPAARWSINYQEALFRNRAESFHSQEGLLGLENTSDLIIRTRTGLRFRLVHGFLATLQANFDWDNSPVRGRTGTDTAYLLTLGYEWGTSNVRPSPPEDSG